MSVALGFRFCFSVAPFQERQLLGADCTRIREDHGRFLCLLQSAVGGLKSSKLTHCS